MARRTPRLEPTDAARLVAMDLGEHWQGVALLGIRGYYLNSMGAPGRNDRGIYDDALFWIARNTQGHITAFFPYQANLDPSRVRPGRGTGSSKGMAVLRSGVWYYKPGLHKGVQRAFRQAEPVTVDRDAVGGGSYSDTGWFGINIHRGGRTTTGSAGCQTVPPDTWAHFRNTGYLLLNRSGQRSFPYVLREGVQA